jgi:hypothetical protein
MDCDTKSKGEDGDHKDDNHKDDDHKDSDNTDDGKQGDNNSDPNEGFVSFSGLPSIARRRSRSPTRRKSNKVPPSIFDRDDTPRATIPEPTVGDIVADYLKQRTASRKRAVEPETIW